MKKEEAEIQQLVKVKRGVAKYADVIEFAKDKRTACHKHFTWDKDKAAYERWCDQARTLIRACTTVIETGAGEIIQVRAYYSLPVDRLNPGGGYRPIQDVLASPNWRAQCMESALADMERFKEKYLILSELASVFAAMDEVSKKAKKPNGRKKQAA